MREIKFRAWDENNEIMICNEFVNIQGNDTLWIQDGDTMSRVYGKDGFELMQFTGLKDKNGVNSSCKFIVHPF